MQLNQSMTSLDHQECYQGHGTTEQSQGHGGSLGGAGGGGVGRTVVIQMEPDFNQLF